MNRRDVDQPEDNNSGSTSLQHLRAVMRQAFTVSKVEPQQRNPERVNVYSDERFVLSLSALEAVRRGIKPGRVIEPSEAAEILAEDTVSQAVEACLRLLTYRPRSERELRDRLRKKGYQDEVVDQALERMRSAGYIDDAEFARFWIQNREQFKPMGARRVRAELYQKGVDRETMQEVIAEEMPEDEYELAMRAARGRLSTYRKLDYQSFYRRMGSYLARQGFGPGTTTRVIKALWREVSGSRGTEGTDEYFNGFGD